MHRVTFQYRLHPTNAQETALQQTLDECRWLYNLLLEQRRRVYKDSGDFFTLYDQIGTLPGLKARRESLMMVHSQVLQNVAVRIDLAFKAFFRRVKAGEKPGFPRFRGSDRYDSFCYPQEGRKGGYYVEGDTVFLSKIGKVRLVLHRPVEGTIKTCCVRRTNTGKWFVTFSCEVPDQPAQEALYAAVGIDMGLASFATLSTGEQIANPRFFRKEEKALATAQRRHAKQVKGTPERRKRRKVVARVHERIANRRKNFAHQHSRQIVNRFTVIVVEDLHANRLAHNHCLAKSISDAAWTQFSTYLAYKAEGAGRRFVAVNPAYTSQVCSRCGHRQKMSLSDRTYHCPCCLLVLDRDQNAARNILALGLQGIGEGPLKPTPLGDGVVTLKELYT
jgi:putative transposase